MKNFLKRVSLLIGIVSLCIETYSPNVYAAEVIDTKSSDSEIVEVEYVPYDYFKENNWGNEDSQIAPISRIKYIIKNATNTGETLGDIMYTSDQGVPGITVGISRSTSISASCSVSGSDIIKAVSSKLGFSVTASYSVGASASWTVPEKYNNRSVKYGYITAKPVYDNWKYDVYIDSSKIDETYLTSGTATKPKNVMRIEKVVVYK